MEQKKIEVYLSLTHENYVRGLPFYLNKES